ncbi:MAG: substrate-binding periplasmic protein [Halodesulfovibrio sp.]
MPAITPLFRLCRSAFALSLSAVAFICLSLAFITPTAHSAPPLTAGDVQAPAAPPTIDAITFMTEDYPPYNYYENGNLKGISVDILHSVLTRLGVEDSSRRIRILPWARGYKTVLETPNTCLFSMNRSPEREQLFQWVGPIAPNTIVVLARKDRHVTVSSGDDLNNYTIATIQDDIAHNMLLKHGYLDNKIVKNPYATSIIEMLNRKRVDAWAYDETVARYFIRQAGYNPNDYERVFLLDSFDTYFAFNWDTDPQLVQKFRDAFNALKEEGKVEEIIHNYTK